jgi:hypothetical protein
MRFVFQQQDLKSLTIDDFFDGLDVESFVHEVFYHAHRNMKELINFMPKLCHLVSEDFFQTNDVEFQFEKQFRKYAHKFLSSEQISLSSFCNKFRTS